MKDKNVFWGMLALVVVIGIAAWFFPVVKNNTPAPTGDGGAVACTTEAKQCPDGSYVGRTGPNCEFSACPSVATSTPRGAGAFCGGIATGAFPCDPGFVCQLNGTYPDAGGKCVKE